MLNCYFFAGSVNWFSFVNGSVNFRRSHIFLSGIIRKISTVEFLIKEMFFEFRVFPGVTGTKSFVTVSITSVVLFPLIP